MNLEPLVLEKELVAIDEDLFTDKDKRKRQKLARPRFWEGFLGKKKLQKTSFVAILYLKDIHAEPLIQKTTNGFFTIDGKTYHERQDCTYTIKIGKDRFPLAIIKDNQIVPFGTKDWDELEIKEKYLACQEHAMSGIRHAERVRMGQSEDKPINVKMIILVVLGLVIAGAVMYGYK